MDIAKAAAPGDITHKVDGLTLFLEPRANDMLSNTNVDFLDGQGFVLSGMEKSSCGTCSC